MCLSAAHPTTCQKTPMSGHRLRPGVCARGQRRAQPAEAEGRPRRDPGGGVLGWRGRGSDAAATQQLTQFVWSLGSHATREGRRAARVVRRSRVCTPVGPCAAARRPLGQAPCPQSLLLRPRLPPSARRRRDRGAPPGAPAAPLAGSGLPFRPCCAGGLRRWRGARPVARAAVALRNGHGTGVTVVRAFNL
jgi:hypothetical protein